MNPENVDFIISKSKCIAEMGDYESTSLLLMPAIQMNESDWRVHTADYVAVGPSGYLTSKTEAEEDVFNFAATQASQ